MQPLMRHANASVTKNTYLQAVTPAKMHPNAASQTFTVLSWLAEARHRPSDLNATPFIVPLCPVWSIRPGFASGAGFAKTSRH